MLTDLQGAVLRQVGQLANSTFNTSKPCGSEGAVIGNITGLTVPILSIERGIYNLGTAHGGRVGDKYAHPPQPTPS